MKDEAGGDKLRGRVIGGLGVPIANAEVNVRAVGDTADGLIQVLGGKTDKEATTEADGSFAVSLPGRWEEIRIEIVARGYLEFSESHDLLEVDGDQDLGLLELDPAVVLGGKVINAKGEEVVGAKVRRTDGNDRGFGGFGRFGNDDSVETDSEGKFELSYEESGTYTLVVTHDDYPTGRFPGETPPAGAMDLGIVLALKPAAVIAGEIIDFPFGREHIRVTARPTRTVAFDDEGMDNAFAEQLGFSADGLEGEVEKTGHFLIEGLEAGQQYTLRAFARGGFFGRSACSDEQVANAGAKEVKLTWDPGGSLAFRVEDERTSGKVKDVDVRYRWESQGDSEGFPDSVKKRSFADGQVEIDELRPKTGHKSLGILVSAPGYLDFHREGIVVREDDSVDLGLIKLRRAPTVRVVILDGDGDPIKRARVRLTPEKFDDDENRNDWGGSGFFSLESKASSGKSDSEGVCELPAPVGETATLSVSHMSFSNFERTGVLMPRDGEREEQVVLVEGGLLEVYVVDTAGNPVADAPIRHEYPEGSNKDSNRHSTNKRGLVRLKNQIIGEHRFQTVENSLLSDIGSEEDDSAEWESVVAVDQQTTQLTLHVAPRASLRGVITANGQPLERATVSLLRENPGENEELIVEFQVEMATYSPKGFDSTDRTDRKGNYKLEDIPTGDYRVSVSHRDRALPYSVPVEIRSGDNKFNIELPITAIQGRVTNADGDPVERALVKVIPVAASSTADGEEERGRQALEQLFGGGRGGRRTDADGRYELVGIPADKTVVIQATADGFTASRSEEITLTHGEVKRKVDIELSGGGTIIVRMVDEVTPFTFLSATYEGDKEPGPEPKAAMVRNGKATFRGLEPGPWRVTRSDMEGDSTGEGQLVNVQSGVETSIDLAP